MTQRAVAGVIATLTIALALSGSAWAQPDSGHVPATVMPLPASPLLVEAAAFAPAQLEIPSIGVTAAVAPVGTVMAPAPFLGGKMELGALELTSTSPGLCLVFQRTIPMRCDGCCPTTPGARNWR